MRKFEELSKLKASENETLISKRWEKEDILNKTIENRKGCPNFVFYDGPIYANAKPGLHHVFSKTIKDAFCKYKTMQGYRVLRKIGLDTHGLPIEVNVEKKLGFKSKADIEQFGIKKFCTECKNETATNIDEVRKVTNMMGQFIDSDNPYVTCSNEYIESEWWIINELNKKGLLYYGNKVLPYCPRCGTELSSFEVAQGYQEVSVNTVIVPFKKENSDEYFLVWTTTPWTLIANVAICVNPEYEYIKVLSKGYKFILCSSLASSVLDDDYEVLETYKGSDLVGIKYEQLMPFAHVEGKAFQVLSDNYVTAEDGTGIVHIAPAYGVDDNRVCKENGIDVINPVDRNGRYSLGPWKERLVTDSELELDIIKWLKENDKLFKKQKISHDYPHCWRCKQPLLYYSKPAWYINNTSKKKEIIEANQGINWYPDYIGEKRFNNWLENMVDWGISRNRFWGTPLPIWECKCGHIETIGSREELKEKAIEDIDINTLELHRPYVDDIHIKCSKCGENMSRVSDVLDVWFDSGAMPYCQYHYPFENKELFASQFPADFIAEGVDQTRGWFYVLLVISTLISGKSSYKNVVVNDMMLDAHGKKMSKSIGNIINPIEIMQEYGADLVRYYMLYTSPVWTPLKFDLEGLKEVYSKFFNPLKNTYNFFSLYANTDNIDIDSCYVKYEDREEIDKWMISKYNKLLKYVTESYSEYDLNKVVKALTNFVSDDLSNWYIRRNRNRFWGSELDNSKKSVYITTYEVLEGLSQILAPISPFISDEIYTKLTGNYSVHTSDFPKYDDALINEEIEQKMDLVRSIISVGRYVREDNKIKVRQPLPEILIDGKNEKIIDNLVDLIKEELNIKKVTYISDLSEYMNFTVKPNFKVVGKIFGKKINAYASKLLELTNEEIMVLKNNSSLKMIIENEEYEITNEMIDISYNAKEGFNVGMEDNNFVILNTKLTSQLIDEGIAREFVSKIQQIRKNLDLDVADRIEVLYMVDDETKKSLENCQDYIMSETLATTFKSSDNLVDIYELNNKEIRISIKKK